VNRLASPGFIVRTDSAIVHRDTLAYIAEVSRAINRQTCSPG
jgi:hypothetical protein